MAGVIYVLIEYEPDGSYHAVEGGDGKPLVYPSAELAKVFAGIFKAQGRSICVRPIDLDEEVPNF